MNIGKEAYRRYVTINNEKRMTQFLESWLYEVEVDAMNDGHDDVDAALFASRACLYALHLALENNDIHATASQALLKLSEK
jgi:hypothetical protein